MKVGVSGSGNVAQHAIRKAMDLGAKVVSASDSGGTVHLPEGFDKDRLAALAALKNVRRGRLQQFADECGLHFEAGRRPWHIPADIALPCATPNELAGQDARTLAPQLACAPANPLPPSPECRVPKGVALSPRLRQRDEAPGAPEAPCAQAQ